MRSPAPLVAAGCAALALVAAAGAIAASRQRDRQLSTVPSVENGAPRGLAAARAWLASTGRPSRVLGPGDAGPRTGEVLLLIAPPAPVAARDVEALVAHAGRGGLAVWAMGDAFQPELVQRLGVRRGARPGDGIARAAPPLAPHPLFDGLRLLTGGATLTCASAEAHPVAGSPGGAAAAVVAIGAGEVVVLAGPDVLENFRLGDGDNLSLLARLASIGPLAFDERHLRDGAAAPRGSLRTAALLVAQALLAAAVLVVALGRRLGEVRVAVEQEGGRSARDYLASLADLYRRAGAERELAEEAWQGLRRELRRRVGIPVGASVEEAARRLGQLRPSAVEPLWRAAEGRATGSLLQVSRGAASLEESLDRASRPGQL